MAQACVNISNFCVNSDEIHNIADINANIGDISSNMGVLHRRYNGGIKNNFFKLHMHFAIFYR